MASEGGAFSAAARMFSSLIARRSAESDPQKAHRLSNVLEGLALHQERMSWAPELRQSPDHLLEGGLDELKTQLERMQAALLSEQLVPESGPVVQGGVAPVVVVPCVREPPPPRDLNLANDDDRDPEPNVPRDVRESAGERVQGSAFGRVRDATAGPPRGNDLLQTGSRLTVQPRGAPLSTPLSGAGGNQNATDRLVLPLPETGAGSRGQKIKQDAASTKVMNGGSASIFAANARNTLTDRSVTPEDVFAFVAFGKGSLATTPEVQIATLLHTTETVPARAAQSSRVSARSAQNQRVLEMARRRLLAPTSPLLATAAAGVGGQRQAAAGPPPGRTWTSDGSPGPGRASTSGARFSDRIRNVLAKNQEMLPPGPSRGSTVRRSTGMRVEENRAEAASGSRFSSKGMTGERPKERVAPASWSTAWKHFDNRAFLRGGVGPAAQHEAPTRSKGTASPHHRGRKASHSSVGSVGDIDEVFAPQPRRSAAGASPPAQPDGPDVSATPQHEPLDITIRIQGSTPSPGMATATVHGGSVTSSAQQRPQSPVLRAGGGAARSTCVEDSPAPVMPHLRATAAAKSFGSPSTSTRGQPGVATAARSGLSSVGVRHPEQPAIRVSFGGPPQLPNYRNSATSSTSPRSPSVRAFAGARLRSRSGSGSASTSWSPPPQGWVPLDEEQKVAMREGQKERDRKAALRKAAAAAARNAGTEAPPFRAADLTDRKYNNSPAWRKYPSSRGSPSQSLAEKAGGAIEEETAEEKVVTVGPHFELLVSADQQQFFDEKRANGEDVHGEEKQKTAKNSTEEVPVAPDEVDETVVDETVAEENYRLTDTAAKPPEEQTHGQTAALFYAERFDGVAEPSSAAVGEHRRSRMTDEPARLMGAVATTAGPRLPPTATPTNQEPAPLDVELDREEQRHALGKEPRAAAATTKHTRQRAFAAKIKAKVIKRRKDIDKDSIWVDMDSHEQYALVFGNGQIIFAVPKKKTT